MDINYLPDLMEVRISSASKKKKRKEKSTIVKDIHAASLPASKTFP